MFGGVHTYPYKEYVLIDKTNMYLYIERKSTDTGGLQGL